GRVTEPRLLVEARDLELEAGVLARRHRDRVADAAHHGPETLGDGDLADPLRGTPLRELDLLQAPVAVQHERRDGSPRSGHGELRGSFLKDDALCGQPPQLGTYPRLDLGLGLPGARVEREADVLDRGVRLRDLPGED